MSIADDVAAAMAADSLWPPQVLDQDPHGADDRALALDEFEQASGLRLPEVYRY